MNELNEFSRINNVTFTCFKYLLSEFFRRKSFSKIFFLNKSQSLKQFIVQRKDTLKAFFFSRSSLFIHLILIKMQQLMFYINFIIYFIIP